MKTVKRHCSICNEMVEVTNKGNQMLKHRWDKHRELMEKTHKKPKRATVQTEEKAEEFEEEPDFEVNDNENGNEDAGENSEPRTRKSQQTRAVVPQRLKTNSLLEANTIAIVPKVMQISSSLLPVGMAITEKEWNWPKDMDPGDWLDTFIFEVFKANGILIGAWLNVSQQMQETAAGGN